MYIGVDLGTSSIKILLSDRNGKILDSETREYPLYFPHEGWSEQNPEDWFETCVSAFQSLSKKYDLRKAKGVSFCGQMHGLVLLDKDDRVIRPAILWNDNRTVEECEYLNNTVGKQNLIEWTGNIALCGFTAPKLLWLQNNERKNFGKIAKIMLPKDYLAYKLSGNHATDVSDASGTLYFDVKNKKWSKQILNILNIRESLLPKVYESYEVIGNITEEFANLTNMSVQTKVIIGGGDQAVGAIGTGTVNDGELSISLGTSGVLFAASDNFAIDKNAGLHSFCHANGKYHVMGVMLSAAGSLKWWTDEILKSKSVIEVLDEVACTRSDGNLIFLPYLMGERSPINDPIARGIFYGLNMGHKQADMTRAILEGVAFGLKDCLKVAESMGVRAKCSRVIGGGAKSKEWLQILADILNIEIKTINTADGGGLGAIILAMVGVGEYASIEDACERIIRDEKTYIPNKLNAAVYQEKFSLYKKLYESCKKFF